MLFEDLFNVFYFSKPVSPAKLRRDSGEEVLARFELATMGRSLAR
jgi:hypothetical protein